MPPTSAWHEVIGEALSQAESDGGLPVVGAVLHSIIAQIARKKGLPFPPKPEVSFKEFLLDNMEVVWVIPRPGQDFVAVPPSRADLAVDSSDKALRADLFKAFTVVKKATNRWYSAKDDSIIETSADVEHPGANCYKIPPVTFEREVQRRQDFVDSQVQGDLRQKLLPALAAPKPLTAFSKAIHENGLIETWKIFRTQTIAQAVRDWSVSVRLPWGGDWIIVREARSDHLMHRDDRRPFGDNARGHEAADLARRRIITTLASLPLDDLKRVKIPLDLVIKVLS